MIIWLAYASGRQVTMMSNQKLDINPETKAFQLQAGDPKLSAWVSANAGSGKTYVLARRVIRLMLNGTPPSRILCLTFTKAAAAEMSNRVFSLLSEWTMLDDAQLAEAIFETSQIKPSEVLLRKARQLFAKALDTPGGLKIQTIHSFCEALLRQFPLEANVTGHFDTLDDFAQRTLIDQARKEAILAASVPSGELHEDFQTILEFANDTAFETALEEIIERREEFEFLISVNLGTYLADIRKNLGVPENATHSSVLADASKGWAQDKPVLQRIIDVANAGGGKKNPKLAEQFNIFLNEPSLENKYQQLNAIYLLKDLTGAKGDLLFGDAKTNNPDLVEWLDRAKQKQLALVELIKTVNVTKATQSLFRIAKAVIDNYTKLKRARGLVDFEDQINEAARLLSRSGISQWVQFKLDQGIDHVLVDEAQDTSPTQWEIINHIVGDFFTGETAGKAGRTIFAVGDEKQSIFSFQGARPELFEEQKQNFARLTGRSGNQFAGIPLKQSFRSTDAILSAVDAVFSNPANAKGLSRSELQTIHETARGTAPGEVQIWPLFLAEKQEKNTDWIGTDEPLLPDPKHSLAKKIATTVKQWIGQTLPGSNKAISHGDILVLVRKRGSFVTMLTQSFREQGLITAGVDRLVLTDHIATQDLIALARFLLTPLDDLSLASVLKSPLFNIDEETLFKLTHNRGGVSLENHVRELANHSHEEAIREIAAETILRIDRYRAFLTDGSAHGFYSGVLRAEDGVGLFRARYGSEVDEILDTFLELALNHDIREKSGLQGFLTRLDQNPPDVKRQVDMEQDTIRIMTVHSAKGLEASIVFLVDSCKSAFSTQHRAKLMPIITGEKEAGHIWQPDKDRFVKRAQPARDIETANAEAEYRRLLYVGMTRAADRLIVSGYRSEKEPGYEYWHSMVRKALLPGSTEQVSDASNEPTLVWRGRYSKADELVEGGQIAVSSIEPEAHQIPDWLSNPPVQEAPHQPPLNPSGAGYALSDDTVGSDLSSGHSSGSNAGTAAKRGTLCHQLLQFLPDLPTDERPDRANAFLERHATDFPQFERQQMAKEVRSILDLPDLSDLFGSTSRAEVSIGGTVEMTIDGNPVKRPISGQIDRIAVSASHVLIADYKTGSRVPDNPEQVPETYIRQLALYRNLVSKIYPDHQIKCLLIWTAKPSCMLLPDALLDQALSSVKSFN